MTTQTPYDAILALIQECEAANKKMLDYSGVGVIDLNVIERAKQLIEECSMPVFVELGELPADFAKGWKPGAIQLVPEPAAPPIGTEPVFWYRPRSDGGYEGPLHANRIDKVRRQSGSWKPLYAVSHAQWATGQEQKWAAPAPEWIVNDLGELGVKTGGRLFFLYKGYSLEYAIGKELGSDGPTQYRAVGKAEFGELCWPQAWVVRGYRDARYTAPAGEFIEGLSDGQPSDHDWRPMPTTKPKE